MQGGAADLKQFRGLADVIAAESQSTVHGIFFCRLAGLFYCRYRQCRS